MTEAISTMSFVTEYIGDVKMKLSGPARVNVDLNKDLLSTVGGAADIGEFDWLSPPEEILRLGTCGSFGDGFCSSKFFNGSSSCKKGSCWRA